jgi:hypothetical protein
MSTKGIYKFNYDCGRMGDLNGIFVAEKKDVEDLITSKIEVYFGEVLGKHSEVYGPIEAGHITLASDDPNAVAVVENLNLSTGFNPFGYSVLSSSMENRGFEPIDDEMVGEALERWRARKGE